MAHQIQIDVKGPTIGYEKYLITCILCTGERVVKMFIHKHEYDNLVRDGFFIRDGKEKDSAGMINTTNVFTEEKMPAL